MNLYLASKARADQAEKPEIKLRGHIPVHLNSAEGMKKKRTQLRGTRLCDCGATISARRLKCLKCAEESIAV